MREIVNTIAAAGLTPSDIDVTQLMQAVRGGALKYFPDSGTQNLLLISPNPAYINYFVGMEITVKPAYGNTGAATINVNGLSPVPIVKKGGTALSGGEWSNGDVITLTYNGTAFQLVGGGSTSGGANLNNWVQKSAGSGNYVVPAGVSYILSSVWGGGGAGAGVHLATETPPGGGGGGFSLDLLRVVPGQSIPWVVGAGAPRTAPGSNSGTAGGTSSFGPLSATGGSGALYDAISTGPTPGGMGYGGSLNLAGGLGRGGFFQGSSRGTAPCGGEGGASWCSGSTPFSGGAQHDGEQPGQGGSGAANGGNIAVAGGAGHDGMITVLQVG